MVRELHPIAGVYIIYGHTHVTGREHCRDVRFYIGESHNLHQRFDAHRSAPKNNSKIDGRTARVLILLELPHDTPTTIRRRHEARFIRAARRMRLALTNIKNLSGPSSSDSESYEAESALLAEAIQIFAAGDKRRVGSVTQTYKMVQSFMQRRFPHAS